MLFNSYIFILFFLPLTVIGYYSLNHFKWYSISKLWLLMMSLWFYAYFNAKYLVIIVGSILFNYFINHCFFKVNSVLWRRLLLVLALAANLGVLFYFKYYDFFLQNINSLFAQDFVLKKLLLPLGISFFTFQQLSYVIDCYKKEVPNYNILDYALFVAFFPQLIAGPILTHNEIVPFFEDEARKKFNYEHFAKGLMALSYGLAKKVLIADTFGNAVNLGYNDFAKLDSTNAIIVMLCYTIQIYFDFSGYCDMATGIGQMFNIDIPMNFNSPYKALTITDFWKRWHITLTRFFTRYIYIPLGGSKKGVARTYLNTFIVFLASGLWHGANWTFVLWGVLHGTACIITKIFSKKIEKLHPVFNWAVTFGFVNLTWIYFRAPSISAANQIIKNILKLQFGPIRADIASCFRPIEFQTLGELLHLNFITTTPNYMLFFFLLFAFAAILVLKNTNERLKDFRPTAVSALVSSVLFVWCILSFSGVSTFLYFNF